MSAWPHSPDLPDRITSAVQPYFEGISEKVLGLVEDRYPKTIQALFELALRLSEGQYGKRLSEAFGFFSDSNVSVQSLFCLLLVDVSRTGQKDLEILTNLKHHHPFTLFKRLSQLEISQIESLVLDADQGGDRSQVDKLFNVLNLPQSDWEALLLIFHRFVAHLVNPSHLLIDLLLKMGHIDRAILCAKTLPHLNEQSKSLHDIVLHLSLNNHCTEAMKLVKFIKNQQEKTHAVAKIIDKLLENKQLDQAVNFAKSLVDSDEIDHALEEVAVQLAEQDAVDRALTIIHSMMDTDVKAYTLSRLVNILSSKGLFRKAIEITFSIEDRGFREDASGYIIKKLLSLRRVDEAIKFVEMIDDPIEKKQAAKIVESAMVAYHQDEKVKRVRRNQESGARSQESGESKAPPLG